MAACDFCRQGEAGATVGVQCSSGFQDSGIKKLYLISKTRTVVEMVKVKQQRAEGGLGCYQGTNATEEESDSEEADLPHGLSALGQLIEMQCLPVHSHKPAGLNIGPRS